MDVFEKKGLWSYEILREGEEVIIKINLEGGTQLPSIEDEPACMSKVIDILLEVMGATKIVLVQRRDYEYDYNQTRMLIEIAKIYNMFVKEKRILQYKLVSDPLFRRETDALYTFVQTLIFQKLKSDPISCYVELKRLLRQQNIEVQRIAEKKHAESKKNFIGLLTYLTGYLEKTRLITLASPYLGGYEVGDRTIYRNILNPEIRPDFIYTKLMASFPPNSEEIAAYSIGGTDITIFKLADSIQYLYHINPPEFKLREDRYDVLDVARKIMAEHKPKRSEFVDPERMREVFYNVGRDLIEELANYRNLKLRSKELDELTRILVRYTVGFGLIEILLSDEKIQDITINSPMGKIPMFIVHQEFDDCKTNIVPTSAEAESWATKLRMISGRPLDEANPILDTELILPKANARVGVISAPLNPTGIAFAIRRHRDEPWTLPLFMKNRMINPLGAGILSFLIDGSRTLLVAGTRSAGKTSLLGSLMVEIMRKYRMITIEDTLELPTPALRKLGYNIQGMKVASAMTRGTAEVSADEGIRTTLRMGDSCLIVGEVRSTEARALYEAMRIGALANVVAGTIHGDSPYGVFDRVVNDLNVPRTSFKATDVIVVANPIKSADGLRRSRRITQITEVRKFWTEDPLLENGFSDLMKYETKTDQLEPSADLINGESDILKAIAGNVKEWAGNWDAVWDNITLRAKTKETLVNLSVKSEMPELLEAKFVVLANDEFHRVCYSVKEDVGALDSKRIFFQWNDWLRKNAKKLKP